MSFGSTVRKTVDEIKRIEDKTYCYDERVYEKVPTKYILSLYRRCSNHLYQYSWYLDEDNHYANDEMKISINYLSNASDRLKKVLDKRENIK